MSQEASLKMTDASIKESDIRIAESGKKMEDRESA